MSAKLVSHSVPTDPNFGSTLLENIAYCARVSNPSNQNNTSTSEKLVRYLMNNDHWSPLEMVSVCLEIETTRDIGRQILRHRSFSFQEFSQRYAIADIGTDIRDARIQDKKNRQNSTETDDTQLQEEWKLRQQSLIDKSSETYKWALDNGIAKEQARAVLPEGNTKSRLYMNGTMRSWIHYIQLIRQWNTKRTSRNCCCVCKGNSTNIPHDYRVSFDIIEKRDEYIII